MTFVLVLAYLSLGLGNTNSLGIQLGTDWEPHPEAHLVTGTLSVCPEADPIPGLAGKGHILEKVRTHQSYTGQPPQNSLN